MTDPKNAQLTQLPEVERILKGESKMLELDSRNIENLECAFLRVEDGGYVWPIYCVCARIILQIPVLL